MSVNLLRYNQGEKREIKDFFGLTLILLYRLISGHLVPGRKMKYALFYLLINQWIKKDAGTSSLIPLNILQVLILIFPLTLRGTSH